MSYALKRMVTQPLIIILVMVMSGTIFAACATPGTGHATNVHQRGRNTMETAPAARSRRPWNEVHSWAYWLDNPDLAKLSASTFDLLVIDYSADGSAGRAFNAAQIAQLRRTDPRRRVVAYLSIGQAEAYRGYWQKAWRPGSPGWLGAEDPDWQGNYWVKYWEPAWRPIVYRYLDAIIAAGFDGVYLDRIDAYQESYAAGHENDMVQFVTDLAHYARTHAPLGEDFGIIVQNAEELAENHPAYVRLVTGIGREEVYEQATDIPTAQIARSRTEGLLDRFLKHSRGRLVLTVDYATKPDLICEAYQRARARGYVPYVTQVELDHLQINASC